MRLLQPDIPWISAEEISEDELVLAATREELATIVGAINEAIEAVEDWEFHTRLGVTSEQARALRSQIGEIVRSAPRPD